MPGPLVLLAPPLLGAAARVLVQGATRAAARTAANKTAQGAATAGAAAGGGVVVNEEVKRRSDAAAQSRSTPVATTTSQTSTRQACKECPPDCGSPQQRSTNGWSDISIEYQHRIGGLPVGLGVITEWMYQVTFDGFDSSQCHLKEAKAKYDQFFDNYGRAKPFWGGAEAMIGQAAAQYSATSPTPQVRLSWFFMEPKSYRYFSKIFQQAFPTIQTVFHP
ncbi:Tox-REase-5 domain-containing protein [Pseudomonas borbori]